MAYDGAMHPARRASAFAAAVLLSALLGGCGAPDHAFNRIDSIAATRDGRTLVLHDAGNSRLVVCDRDFKLKRIITHPDFFNVWGLSINDTGEIVVVNERPLRPTFDTAERKALAVLEFIHFDLGGRELRRLQWFGEKGPVVSPSSPLPLRDGTFLVPETRTCLVLRIGAAGEFLASFGGIGRRGGLLDYPNDVVAVPGRDEFLVVDTFASRLPVFSPDGRFLREISSRGTEEGRLMFPEAATFDAAGDLYVAELHSMRVSRFGPDGAFKRAYPLKDPEGGFPLVQLFDVLWVDGPAELLVADTLNSRILVLDPESGEVKRSVGGFAP